MPHDSTHIFSQGEYGVTPGDVASVLGVASSEVSTLCESKNINMWAKFKPVRWATYNHLSSNWFKSEKGNYGIAPMTFDRLKLESELGKFTNDGLHGWEYEGVTSGYWHRLGDFDGYFHNAKPPYGSLTLSNTSHWGASLSAVLGLNIHEGDNVAEVGQSTSEVTFQMLLGKNYIHPVFVIQNVTDDMVVPQLLQPNDNNGFSYNFHANDEYKVYPLFYVSDSATKDGTVEFSQRTLYTCAGVLPRSIVLQANLSLSSRAVASSRNGIESISVEVSVTNISGKDITLPNCFVWLRLSEDYTSALLTGQGERELVSLQSFTAKALSTTYVCNRMIVPQNGMTAAKARIVISLDRGNKQQTINVMRESDNQAYYENSL